MHAITHEQFELATDLFRRFTTDKPAVILDSNNQVVIGDELWIYLAEISRSGNGAPGYVLAHSNSIQSNLDVLTHHKHECFSHLVFELVLYEALKTHVEIQAAKYVYSLRQEKK